jgi:hypothetical protein
MLRISFVFSWYLATNGLGSGPIDTTFECSTVKYLDFAIVIINLNKKSCCI